jgi:microcystin degradation protein MlrC
VAEKLRIAVGAMLFEGNTLSPVRTTLDDFRNKYLARGREVLDLADSGIEIAGALQVLNSIDAEIVPLLATHGGAGGRVTGDCHTTLKAWMLEALRDAGDLDGVYLALHGAMIAEGIDDVETDLLVAVRDIVGDIPVVISCDLHAHVTPSMVELADAIVGYQHYPHDDAFETGVRSVGLLARTLRGEVKPVMAMRKVAAIFPAGTHGTREPGPMRDLYRKARAQEATSRPLTLSYFPVQPWLDLPEVGFAAVAVTDGDEDDAVRIVDGVVRDVWRRRHEFEVQALTPVAALRAGAEVEGGPVVLAEVSDCVGGGASGDSAILLEAYLSGGHKESLAIHIVDPETAAQAAKAGIGATFDAQIGNKMYPGYGVPVAASVAVERLFDGRFTYVGGLMAGIEASMGPCAVLALVGARVLVSTHSAYEYADEQFQCAGIDTRNFKYVVAKNPMNYKHAYASAPKQIVVRSPGPTTADLASVDWRRLSRPFFPADDPDEPPFLTGAASSSPPIATVRSGRR